MQSVRNVPAGSALFVAGRQIRAGPVIRVPNLLDRMTVFRFAPADDAGVRPPAVLDHHVRRDERFPYSLNGFSVHSHHGRQQKGWWNRCFGTYNTCTCTKRFNDFFFFIRSRYNGTGRNAPHFEGWLQISLGLQFKNLRNIV